MKKHLVKLSVMAGVLFTLAVSADEEQKDRFSFSTRLGFDVKVRFKGINRATMPANSRTTPNGDPYNYEDGYVYPDSFTSEDGRTTYWGYDDSRDANSGGQVSGNSILFHNTTDQVNARGSTMKEDPSLGAELVYSRELWRRENVRFGLELAGNYMGLSMGGSRAFSATRSRTTYAYPFEPGTTPPTATPNDPFQGTRDGAGYLIISNSFTTSTEQLPGATLIDRQRFDADIWGFRFGPYAEFPISECVNVQVSGGLAGALVDSEAAWSIIGTSLSGRGSHCDMLWGGYLAANLEWQMCEHWSFIGGVQYQNVGTYERSYGGRRVELDLSHSFFVALGIGYSFK